MKNLPSERRREPIELPPAFDRRRRERVALSIPVRILSSGFLADKADVGTCTDLSEGGVSFECSGELNVGDMIVLEFKQKSEPSYRCHARLAYRLGRKYGAYFLTGE